MAHLTRAWQMLLKGLQEVSHSGHPLMAAEMVLIRLAYAAEMPSAVDLVKAARDPARQSAQAPASPAVSPQPAAPAPSTPGDVVHVAPTMRAALAEKRDQSETTALTSAPAPVQLTSFIELVEFVGKRRDIKLKAELERNVRPVRIASGQLEIALEPGASRGLPGELARKLEAWTGMRWIVSLSQEAGETPLHKQRTDRRDSLFARAP